MTPSNQEQAGRKILFVTHTSAPGGAELTLLNYIRKSEVPDITLASLESGGVWTELRTKIRVLESEPRNPAGAALALSRLFHRERPALVVANTMRSALYCALAVPRKTPLAYWIHDGLGKSSAMGRSALLATRHVTLRRVDYHLTNSDWTAETLAQWLPHANPTTVAPPCGISGAAVTGRNPQAPLADEPLRLLYLGRIAEWKAPHLAIEAVKRYNERSGRRAVALTLAGGAQFDGDHVYATKLQALAAEAGDAVRMVGHVSDIGKVFEEHHALIHCSTTPEPFGRVIVEAMSYGLPAIAADAGAPASIIDPGVDGLLYAPGNVEDLMAKIEQLLYSRLDEYSAACLRTAKLYSDENLVPKLDRTLSQWAAAGRSH